MHKNIGPAIFWRDEAKTFIVIEKLYSANCHVILFDEAIKSIAAKDYSMRLHYATVYYRHQSFRRDD
ncbi:hypothetical protein HED63_24060 [Ochrobactrum cytisi]|nr:hypothetical protein [Brucella cytisi]